MKLEIVGMYRNGGIPELNDDFHGFSLGSGGEIQQWVFIELQLRSNAFKPRIGIFGHDTILTGVAVMCSELTTDGSGTATTGVLKTSSQFLDVSSQLFVAQGFDGVEFGGFDGGQHAADDAHEAENASRPDESGGIDGQVNIAFIGALLECAPQG